jgi:hypothetical protein
MTYAIDYSQPVELGHPLNHGKVVWLLPINLGGALMHNVMRLGETQNAVANHGVLANAPTFGLVTNAAGNQQSPGMSAIRLRSASSQYADCGVLNGYGTIAEKTVIVKCNPTTLSGGRPLAMPEDDTATDRPAIIMALSTGATGGGIEVGGAPSYNGKVSFTATAGLDYHLVASVRGKNVRAYVNGGYIGTATSTTTFAANPKLYIGRYNGNYGQYFNGNVYSAIVYNRAVGQEEVWKDYEWSCRGYIGPDSPLRCFVSSRTWFVPASAPVTGNNTPAIACGLGW